MFVFTKKPITAEKARFLVRRRMRDELKQTAALIERAAKEGRTSIWLADRFWCSSIADQHRGAAGDYFRQLGFAVKFTVKNHLGDTYTEISWERGEK